MTKLLIVFAAFTPGFAVAQTIANPVTNTDTTSPSTSTAVPRVGENVDEATAATQRSARRDARTPGPTTERDRRDAAAAHKAHDKGDGRDMHEPEAEPR